MPDPATSQPAALPSAGVAPDVLPGDPLAHSLAAIATLPWQHPRHLGLWLARFGAGLSLVAVPCSIALLNIGLAIGLAGLLLALLPVHRLVGFIPGMLLALWMGVSLLANRGHQPGPEYIGLGYIWVQLLVAQVAFRHRATVRVVLPLLALTTAAAAALAAVQYFHGLDPSVSLWRVGAGGIQHRASGFYSLTLTLGHVAACLLLLFISPLAWSAGRGDAAPRALRVRGPLLAAGGAFAALVALVTSTSRGGVLGALAGIGALLFARCRNLLRTALVVGVLALAIGTLGYLANPQRVRDMLNGQDGRWPIWQVSLHLAKQVPVVGLGGPEAFSAAYREAFPQVLPGAVSEFPEGAPHAHNTPLALAADYGVPAALAFIALLLAPLAFLVRRRLVSPQGWRLVCAVTAAAGVACLFEVLHSPSSHVTWLLLGLALGWAAQERAAQEREVCLPAEAKEPAV